MAKVCNQVGVRCIHRHTSFQPSPLDPALRWENVELQLAPQPRGPEGQGAGWKPRSLVLTVKLGPNKKHYHPGNSTANDQPETHLPL